MAGKNNTGRIKNLYLPGIRLPVGGIVSILHRVSGILLVLSLPLGLWSLQRSLAGPDEFAQLQALFSTLPARAALLAIGLIGIHHLLAGVRHLLLDIDVGITRRGGRIGAWLVLAAGLGAASLLGGWLFIW
jgi:succinate dehydrogenase / fumarate reductase cytochrome b subunit